MFQELLSWQTNQQPELMAVDLLANAALGELCEQQLLVWQSPFYQPQEKDHLHGPGAGGQQDMQFSSTPCIDVCFQPTWHTYVRHCILHKTKKIKLYKIGQYTKGNN